MAHSCFSWRACSSSKDRHVMCYILTSFATQQNIIGVVKFLNFTTILLAELADEGVAWYIQHIHMFACAPIAMVPKIQRGKFETKGKIFT